MHVEGFERLTSGLKADAYELMAWKLNLKVRNGGERLRCCCNEMPKRKRRRGFIYISSANS
jgi:hypothetical protein